MEFTMSIRRYYVPNSIVFITQVINYRKPVFRYTAHLQLLRAVMYEAKERYPFKMLAYCFLPDHFHLLIHPAVGVTHSQIMHSIKPNFTKQYKEGMGLQGSMKFWQKRYWDHIIRDEDDLADHLDYIHYNPVKHKLVAKPEDWPNSSFRYWREKGNYPPKWGWSLPPNLDDFRIEPAEDDS